MATESEVLYSAKEFFAAMADRLGTAWPNDAGAEDGLPRYEFRTGPVINNNQFLEADTPSNSIYLLQVNVVVAQNTFEEDINLYVQRVIDRFSFGTTYDDFTVTQRPERGAPIDSDSGEYRIPITIRLQALTE